MLSLSLLPFLLQHYAKTSPTPSVCRVRCPIPSHLAISPPSRIFTTIFLFFSLLSRYKYNLNYFISFQFLISPDLWMNTCITRCSTKAVKFLLNWWKEQLLPEHRICIFISFWQESIESWKSSLIGLHFSGDRMDCWDVSQHSLVSTL